MVVFPNCKLNIGLQVTGKRNDGYHNLQTVFFPLPLRDALEIILNESSVDDVTFSSSGLEINGEISDNICIKAYHLLKKDYPSLPSVKMHLHKTIPMGAGLGGGSANGAFALKLIDEKFELNLTNEQLLTYALQLGSDCPFFILNKPCFATGRGEILHQIALDLSLYQILIINPGIHVSTAKAFAMLDLTNALLPLQQLIAEPITSWKAVINNEFEKPVFKLHPEIAQLKNEIYSSGAIYASMSGSGSTVYGIFNKGERPAFNLPSHYFFCWL